nr:reverse transcriptase domain-containing protein [Tanacetum cinerariifolium]
SVTSFARWIEDYPFPDGLKMPSHVGSYEKRFQRNTWQFTTSNKEKARVSELSPLDHPSTYKGLIEKTYTWIKAGEVATNGAPNDQRDNFKRSRKSSWDNNRGQKSKDRKREKASSCVFGQPNIIWARARIPKTGKAHTDPRICRKKAAKIFSCSPHPGQTPLPKKDREIKDGEAERKEPELENAWKLFIDKASSSDSSGAGSMLVNPEGKEYTYALRFEFETTNNEAEYEALLAEYA